MSTTELPDRPAFQSRDEGVEFDRPPFSRLAYVAFAGGLVSLFAAFSTILLPLAMLATGLGVAVVWKLSRDKQLGGLGLAQCGLTLSTAAIFWSLAARTASDNYLYQQAGEHAKIFLETLAAGKEYEALELRQVESSRQLTGTNLEKYYSQLDEEEQQGYKGFLASATTKSVIASGPNSDWQFSRGLSVASSKSETLVSVEMINRAQPGSNPIIVQMRRQLGLLTDPDRRNSTALWSFAELRNP